MEQDTVIITSNEYRDLIYDNTQYWLLLNAIKKTSLLSTDKERLIIDPYELEKALRYTAPDFYNSTVQNLRSKECSENE